MDESRRPDDEIGRQPDDDARRSDERAIRLGPEALASNMDTPGWSNANAARLAAATGATAGSPGAFTPAGCARPATFGALTGITAAPATAWTSGQYVLLDDKTKAYWNATAWTSGTAP